MPATNLALFNLALLIRLTRAGAREALLQDYVKFARAKGLSNARVIGVHVLRNILIPIVTVIGLQFGALIAFAIVTESVFAWPGMGKLLIDSINVLDRPVIVAYLLVIVTLFIVINLIVDVLYSVLDPRVRLTEIEGMSDVGARRAIAPLGGARCAATRRVAVPRIVGDFCANPVAVFGLVLLGIILFARAVRAADLAAESLRPRAARRDGQPAAAAVADADRRHVLARHRRPGPRHAVGDLLRPAHQPRRRRRRRRCSRCVIGLAMGLAAAYFGGRVESLIMRIVDIQLSFPAILIALILIAVLGQGIGKVIAALVTVQWAYYARTVRSAALVEKRKEYMEAARCLALPPARIVFRHLLPNCLPPMIVVATVQVAAAIALEATLSFLGLGLPITEPSLGLLIANGYQYLLSGKYWISFFPGIALLLTIVSINLVADQLRDVLNPQAAAMRRR